MNLKEIRRANLLLLVEYLAGNKLAELGEMTGTTPSLFSQIKNRSRGMGEELARKLENSLDLPASWMDEQHDETYRAFIERLYGPDNTKPQGVREESADDDVPMFQRAGHELVDPRSRGKVPIISWVKAGEPDLAIDLLAPGDAIDWKYCNARHSNQTYGLIVEGDSMHAPYGKSYPDKSVIFVDPEQRGGVATGEPIIAKIKGVDQVVFKVLARDADRVFLKPLNPQYPIITAPFRVLGKVIGKWEDE